jgi:hypothetical protein
MWKALWEYWKMGGLYGAHLEMLKAFPPSRVAELVANMSVDTIKKEKKNGAIDSGCA